jgi:hypothetical protein
VASAQGTAICRDESSLSATLSLPTPRRGVNRVELLGAYPVVSHHSDVHGRRGPGHLYQLTTCDLFTGSPTGVGELEGGPPSRDGKHRSLSRIWTTALDQAHVGCCAAVTDSGSLCVEIPKPGALGSFAVNLL